MTRNVDQLAAHVAAGQGQIMREITALQTVEQQILDDIWMAPASPRRQSRFCGRLPPKILEPVRRQRTGGTQSRLSKVGFRTVLSPFFR
jgi:hypothetical protein